MFISHNRIVILVRDLILFFGILSSGPLSPNGYVLALRSLVTTIAYLSRISISLISLFECSGALAAPLPMHHFKSKDIWLYMYEFLFLNKRFNYPGLRVSHKRYFFVPLQWRKGLRLEIKNKPRGRQINV